MIAPTISIASNPSLRIIEKQAINVAAAALLPPPDCSASTSSTTCLMVAVSALPAFAFPFADEAGCLPSRMFASL